MPTAAQFYAAMKEVEDILKQLSDRASDIEKVAGQTGFTGARMVATIDDCVLAAATTERQAVDLGDQIMIELERRMHVCENHAAAVTAWNSAYDAADSTTRATMRGCPPAPEPWVEI